MSTELAIATQGSGLLMPVAEIQEAVQRRNMIAAYVRTMKEGEDYGVIPGTRGKPTLFKQGAENLTSFFGLVPDLITTESIIDFDGSGAGNGEGLIYYEVRCDLYRNGTKVGSGTAVCSSREKKYRYRNEWIKGQKQQVINLDIADIANTVKKMADKRALVAATLIATGASAHFTQDVEDMADVTIEATPVKPAPKKDEPKITDNQRKRLHALGNTLYGKDAWEQKRAELVAAATKNQFTSASHLTEAQAQKLIDGMDKKLQEGQQTLVNGAQDDRLPDGEVLEGEVVI